VQASGNQLVLQGGIVFGSVYVQSYEWVIDRKIFDVGLVLMFDLSGSGGCRSPQECLNQFATKHKGMPVLSFEFRDYSPNLWWRLEEGLL
jgi:hypothetical protein